MDEDFFDTSWSLHYHPINNQGYKKLFSAHLEPDQLEAYSERLTKYLSLQQKSQYKDDVDEENERIGALEECRWSTISQPVTSLSAEIDRESIYIELIYEKQTFKFILYSPYLTLSKASATHSKRVFDFFTETFGISLDILKISSPSFLSTLLEDYVTDITQPFEMPEMYQSEYLNRLGILEIMISNLKLTIAFSAPVAPLLKTIDLDIPYETVDSLLSSSPQRTDPSNHAGAYPLARLAHYISEQTGLNVPLSVLSGDGSPLDRNSDPASTPVMRLTKVTTAYFAFSNEGKIKFSSKARRSEPKFGEVIDRAGGNILYTIASEAEKRGQS